MSALVRTTIGTMPLAVHQRQVALEPAQVEVVVQAHHEQGPVDVADDRMAAAVAVAAGDVRKRRHAPLHPARARGVARGEHPVADGEHRAVFEQLAREPRHLARRALAHTVVKLHGLAVHRADPQQVETLIAALGRVAGALGECRREADALEAIEIEWLKHVESEARVAAAQAHGRGSPADGLPERAMREAPGGGAGFERLRWNRP
jgi:hypothetical protein